MCVVLFLSHFGSDISQHVLVLRTMQFLQRLSFIIPSLTKTLQKIHEYQFQINY